VHPTRATGESYTIAHHVYTEDGNRKIMIASLRYGTCAEGDPDQTRRLLAIDLAWRSHSLRVSGLRSLCFTQCIQRIVEKPC
jgi:hypothetical protein